MPAIVKKNKSSGLERVSAQEDTRIVIYLVKKSHRPPAVRIKAKIHKYASFMARSDLLPMLF